MKGAFMARSRGGAPRGFKFSGSGRGRASRQAGGTSFKRISRRSTGGRTKTKTPGFK